MATFQKSWDVPTSSVPHLVMLFPVLCSAFPHVAEYTSVLNLLPVPRMAWGEVLISVQDNGVNIPGGEQSGTFEYFFLLVISVVIWRSG